MVSEKRKNYLNFLTKVHLFMLHSELSFFVKMAESCKYAVKCFPPKVALVWR